jgi:hypothetical protein
VFLITTDSSFKDAQAQAVRIGPKQREHLALRRRQATAAGLGPSLLLEGNADLGQPGRDSPVERLVGRQGIVGPHRPPL